MIRVVSIEEHIAASRPNTTPQELRLMRSRPHSDRQTALLPSPMMCFSEWTWRILRLGKVKVGRGQVVERIIQYWVRFLMGLV